MFAKTSRIGFAVIVLIAWAAPAVADVVNGDFESGSLSNWQPGTFNGALAEVVNGYGGNSTYVAHLKAETTYTWDDGQSLWDGSAQQAALQQGVFTIYSLTTVAGETALEFDGLALITGEDMSPPSVNVSAAGGSAGGTTVTSASWNAYTFDLIDPLAPPGLLGAGSPINIAFNVAVAAPFRTGDYDGEQVTQTVELYLDNVHLTPVPGAGVLMLAGAAAMLRRRRR